MGLLLGAAARATPLISPAAGSDAIRAMRNDAEPLLLLSYKIEHSGQPTESVTLGLATDYHYEQRASDGLSITDYRLKRIFRAAIGGTMISDSLYALAWYRQAELDNRANVAAMLKKANVDSAKGMPAQDPFWAESGLGVATPKFPLPDLHRKLVKDRVSWSLGSAEVVAVRYRDPVLPPPLRAALRRWWPSIAAIHPAIADELAQSGKVPAELWLKELVRGKDFETAHWTLSDARFIDAAKYPLPAGLAAAPAESRQASPIANFCKDAGDFYARGWQPFAAWQVYDLGRMMANHRSGDLLEQMDKLEAALEKGMPSLF